MKTFVSLWSADLTRVADAMAVVDEATDGYHIDVMDGHFTPQLLFGPDFVSAVRQNTNKVIDVHLMVDAADMWIAPFADAGADMITIHTCSTTNLAASLDAIRELGKSPSLALTTGEPVVDGFETALDHDRLLLMGTEIGIKGVDIDPNVYSRIEEAYAIRDKQRPGVEIFVDGGIRSHTVGKLAAAGADGVIPGSLVFGVADPASAIAHLHSLGVGEGVRP